MPIYSIASAVEYKGKLGIGCNGGRSLLYKLSGDLKYFKGLTTSCPGLNIVVMGRKTWFSIPQENRPLKGRVNIVLTKDRGLINHRDWKTCCRQKGLSETKPYFMTFETLCEMYERSSPKPNLFIIGGGEIYQLFVQSVMRPAKVYLTQIFPRAGPCVVPDTFMEPLPDYYKLTSVSEKMVDVKENGVEYRFLAYTLNESTENRNEAGYLNLIKRVLSRGRSREDRTGVGTIGTFGETLRFDISHQFPLLTTKRVPWKHVIEELLWFLRGDTDSKILNEKGVKIWNGNSSREFLDGRGLKYAEGVCGPIYGWQWRFFGAKYSQAFSDTRHLDTSKLGGIDQLEWVVNELKTNPWSRRIVMSCWNPSDFDKMALLPCHYTVQFYVREHEHTRYLDCCFNMRSTDVGLGLPFNIASYAALTYILAIKTDMKPGELVYCGGDVHIYKTHIEALTDQTNRSPISQPILLLDPSIKTKRWHEIQVSDFEVVGYFPHPPVKMKMAV